MDKSVCGMTFDVGSGHGPLAEYKPKVIFLSAGRAKTSASGSDDDAPNLF